MRHGIFLAYPENTAAIGKQDQVKFMMAKAINAPIAVEIAAITKYILRAPAGTVAVQPADIYSWNSSVSTF